MKSPRPTGDKINNIAIVIPAFNEEGCIELTVRHLHLELIANKVPHEIVVVDDGSSDNTWQILMNLTKDVPTLKPVRNLGPHGFGRAVICGLQNFDADAVAVMMADNSDDANDVVRYWHKLNEGYDCVFGSRFMKGGGVIDYPVHKLIMNRMANLFVRIMFNINFNDTTNAFKAYRKRVIKGCAPFISPHFNLTVEIPLKAMVRGYSWTVIPITWKNRRTGISKLKIQEMGSRYLFICLYLWLEKHLTRDYRVQPDEPRVTSAEPPEVVPPKAVEATHYAGIDSESSQ
ncbi:MAG TPA: glycosyltransferase family 2 protein [Candidatus Melainabacteria bacterium]|nr:glycosyltransferase family 2 protein [Candidatus Melainabacteria bacterium]